MTPGGTPAGDLRDVEGARVLVAGLGVSGRAARDAVAPLARAVLTYDEAQPADLPTAADAAAALTGGAADLVVTSPGLAPHHPVLAAAEAAGVPVWSEVELAWRLRVLRAHRPGPAPWLAVTGTNGKTTTVGMLAAILTAAGRRTAAVGNVGDPAVAAVTDPTYDVLALELSSYQLHFTHTMAVQAGAVLNVAPDHLDWHGSMAAYAADKGRIHARAEVACVYSTADPVTADLVRAAEVAPGALAVGVGLGVPGPGQLGLVEDALVDRAFHLPPDHPARGGSAVELATLGDLAQLAGPDGRLAPHVVLDALAAAALARAHGVDGEAVAAGLRSFGPGEHRISFVGVVDEVAYVDDSKATNAHAAAASLAGFAPGTVVWVAGGLAKGATFDELVTARADRLRAVVLIGVDQRPLAQALARHAPAIPVEVVDPTDTGSVMSRAVTAARRVARPGDTVLLAPACASMDQFTSYAHRGEAFAAAVTGTRRVS